MSSTSEKVSEESSSDSSDEDTAVPYLKMDKTKWSIKKEASSDSSDASEGDTILPDIKIGNPDIKIEPTNVEETSSKTQMTVEDEVDGNGSDSDSDSDISDSEYVCDICRKKFSGYIPLKQHEKGKNHLKTVMKKKREKKLLEKIAIAEKMTESDEEEMVLKKPFAICKPCGKQFTGQESYYHHIVSKDHKKKVHQSSVLNQVCDEGEINVEKLKDHLEDIQSRITSHLPKDEEDIVDIDEFECKECDKSFSGLVPYAQHLISKVHAKKVEKNKLLQKLTPEDSDDIQKSQNPNRKDIITLVVEDGILVCKLCSTSFSGPENAMMHMKSRGHFQIFEKQKRKQEKKLAAAVAAAALKIDSDSDDESVNAAEIKPTEVKKESRRTLESSNIDLAEENLIASVSTNEKGGDQVKSEVGNTLLENNSRRKFTSSSKVTAEEASVSENSKTDDKRGSTVEDSETKVDENKIAYKKYKEYKKLMNSWKKEDADI